MAKSRRKAVGRKQTRPRVIASEAKQSPIRDMEIASSQKPLLAMTNADAPYELPDGWKWTAIGEACAVNPRMQWPEGFAKNKPVHFVPMSAVDGETGAIVSPEPRPISEVWKGYKRFQDGDVIFARITPCMENGKAAIARNLLNGIGLGSTEFHVLRAGDKISAEWIYHFVRQQTFRNEAARAMTGTAGQLRVPADFVAQSAIPLPPLPEQQRIVARIESLFAESRTARDALERVPALLKRFRQSVLAAAFRGGLTSQTSEVSKTSEVSDAALPDGYGWAWVKLGDLLTFVGSGITPKGGQKVYKDSGVPFIRSQNVYPDGLRLENVAYVSAKLHAEMSRTHLQSNDVLLNITGASIGRSTVVPASLGQANVNQHVCILRTLPGLNKNYLSRFLNSPSGQDQIMEAQSGVTRQGLNYEQIRAFIIPLPPLTEQRRIVAKIEALFAQADAIERAVVIARQRADKIDQAILARVFRGEL